MASFTPDFGKYTDYTTQYPFNSVIFPANAPLNGEDLNEMQEIIKERGRLALGALLSDGYIHDYEKAPEPFSYSIDDDSDFTDGDQGSSIRYTFDLCGTVIYQGTPYHIENTITHEFLGTSPDLPYGGSCLDLVVEEVEVTADQEEKIYPNGFGFDSESLNNYLADNIFSAEVSRRKAVKFSLEWRDISEEPRGIALLVPGETVNYGDVEYSLFTWSPDVPKLYSTGTETEDETIVLESTSVDEIIDGATSELDDLIFDESEQRKSYNVVAEKTDTEKTISYENVEVDGASGYSYTAPDGYYIKDAKIAILSATPNEEHDQAFVALSIYGANEEYGYLDYAGNANASTVLSISNSGWDIGSASCEEDEYTYHKKIVISGMEEGFGSLVANVTITIDKVVTSGFTGKLLTASYTSEDSAVINYQELSIYGGGEVDGGNPTCYYRCYDATNGFTSWMRKYLVNGQLANGTLVTLPDGRTLTFGEEVTEQDAIRNDVAGETYVVGKCALVLGDYDQRTYYTESEMEGASQNSLGDWVKTGNLATGEWAIAAGTLNTSSGNYSVSLGLQNFSAGSRAVTIGHENEAHGFSAIAIGDTNSSDNRFAISFGHDNVSSGVHATTIGYKNTSSGKNAISQGYANTSSGEGAVTLGGENKASGKCSVSAGNKARALSASAISLGFSTTAGREEPDPNNSALTGEYCVAMGWKATANGLRDVALGNNPTASGGYGAVSLGSNTTASGQTSLAIGCSSTAKEKYSNAIGWRVIASSPYQTVVGKANIADSSNAYMFILGNGTSDTARSNAMTVDWDGNAWFAGTVTVGDDQQEVATKVDGAVPIEQGGTGATTAAGARANLGAASQTDVDSLNTEVNQIASSITPITYGTEDLTAGVSELATGSLYFVYE